MRTMGFIAGVATAATLITGTAAMAQLKGTGKQSLTIIRWDESGNVPISGKAAGSYATKPKASVVGLPPTGGTTNTVKLPFQPGPTVDALKPGFPAGDYILDLEASDTSTGNANTVAFVHLQMSALGKCTALSAPTVDGLDVSDWCNTIGTACSPTLVDKCTFTTYQVAGSLSALAPGDGQPSASRIRLRKRVTNCETGDIITAGTEIRPNNAGAFDAFNHDCRDGAVVGVMGVANGDVTP